MRADWHVSQSTAHISVRNFNPKSSFPSRYQNEMKVFIKNKRKQFRGLLNKSRSFRKSHIYNVE
jgi:hypothetical protein